MRWMPGKACASLLCAAVLSALAIRPAAAAEVVFARHLALAPDGGTLAFCWAGDIWTVPSGGGAATRLTVHPANDRCPVWSRDGTRLAFASDRHGADNVFVMNRDGSALRRLTFSDRDEIPTDWSLDGTWVYFHSRREGDVSREPRLFRVPAAGGQSWRVVDCHGASLRFSPDGARFAFVRGATLWGRRGYRGSAASDVWIHNLADDSFTQLTDFDGPDRDPQWDADGRTLYFLSERSGNANVWRQRLDGGPAEQVTRMTGEDVRDFSLAADGRTLALTHWDKVYVLTPGDALARAVRITVPDDTPQNDVELKTFAKDADELAPSPDGKELAVVVRGEVFVLQTQDDKPTRRVMESAARERDVTWSPDGKALYFVSDRAGQEDIYRAVSAEQPTQPLSDSLRFRIERVTDDPAVETDPAISPDGKRLAFVRGRGDLIVRDLASGQEQVRLTGWSRPRYQWSPDSRWLAYRREDREENADVWVGPADGHEPDVNVSQHPDFDGEPQWSADGQVLAFTSRRDGFDTDVYLVFLSRKLDESAPVELDEYFKQQSEALKKRKPPKSVVASGPITLGGATSRPVESQPTTAPASAPGTPESAAGELTGKVRAWLKRFLEEPDKADGEDKERARKKPAQKYEYELATCYQRIRRVTTLPGDQGAFALAPDGQSLAFTSRHEGEEKLYTVKWNGKDTKRIVNDGARGLRWSLDGKRLLYLKDGVPQSCSDSGGDAKTHAFRAKLAIVRSEEAGQKFDDAVRQLGLYFYHPTMKGLDWAGLARKYRALALRTRTIHEFNEIFTLLLGELNASHLGIAGPAAGGEEQVGQLGCRLDRAYAGPGLKVAAVVPRTPADRAASRLVAGDILLKVNGVPVGPEQALDAALINTVGDEVVVEYAPAPERPTESAPTQPATAPATQPATRELVIRPISSGALAGLMYDAWVEQNRKYVEERSGGRVGYLHIRGMDEGSFRVFERDLYAAGYARDGLIIDVRNNGGGWTADWVMAVLCVRRHAFTVPRGGEPGYPQDRLIFYAWTKPTTMMCNEQSFSNAEIVAHAFKTLGRGPLVGTRTAGGVISTGSYTLIDGAQVRIPGRGWYTLPDGVDMENNGAVPDVQVLVTPADETQARQPQLDAAIAATLAQLERPATQPSPAERGPEDR